MKLQKEKESKTDRIMLRNERIRKRYNDLIQRKRFAADYALEILADEFVPLKSETIWLIVSQTGFYKDK